LGDKGDAYLLTHIAYEEALISQQANQDSNDGSVFQVYDQNRYNLRSKQNNNKQDEQAPPKKIVFLAKQQPRKDQA